MPIATALRECWKEGALRPAALRADLLAGCVVGIVALPLSMALAIASGVPPAARALHGHRRRRLIALLGGSRFQVVGPDGGVRRRAGARSQPRSAWGGCSLASAHRGLDPDRAWGSPGSGG